MTRTQHVAIKGTRDGLVLFLDPQAEFSVVMDELAEHLQGSAQFLHGAAVRCYSGEKKYSDVQCEMLSGLLTEHGLVFAGWLSSDEVYSRKQSQESMSGEKEAKVWDEGMEEGPSLFIERTLRSGASIQFNGHVIVLGDVNPGAEIIASGNIIVIGALRGVAHAGATGNRKAIVSAYHLAPTQLRIADMVTRAPDDSETERGPEIARIKDDRLTVEARSLR